MRLKEAERIRKEEESHASEKQLKLKLALLKKQIEEKRNRIGDFIYSSLSPSATVKEMQEVNAKILSIKKKYRQVLAKSIEVISVQVNDIFEKANKEVKNEFESNAEYEARIKLLRNEASKKQSNGFIDAKKKIEHEYNTEVEPFINALKKLSAQEFQITSQDLKLEIGKYNGEYDVYPVSIRSLKSFNGVLLACNANIPIPRQEAKVFKQHYKNNILRPQIKGNFQSIEFFRIAEAYIIDDATSKEYDLFSSKFVEVGNEIVYDSDTNLLWLKNANYIKEGMYPYNTIKAVQNLTIAGLSGWRIPTNSEIFRMKTVYLNQEPHPFLNIGDYYLTSDTCYEGKGVYYLRSWKSQDCCYNPENDCHFNKAWPVRGR